MPIDHDSSAREYIIYACPLGPLAAQLDRYFTASRARYGPNTAHAYMPHCTLTGFFHDSAAASAGIVAGLDRAYQRAMAQADGPALTVRDWLLREDFHGLLLDATWLRGMIADFAQHADSPTRRDAIRRKDWLHLSLAYGFPPAQHTPLAALASALVDSRAPVRWELRCYERHAAAQWTCHAQWPLDS